MTKKLTDFDQELYLAAQESIPNATEIAELSLEEERYPFIIQYVPTEKETVFSNIKKIGCNISKHLDFANCLAVSMSMSQLKAIKSLDGIESVEVDYDYRVLTNQYEESDSVSGLKTGKLDSNIGDNIRLALFDTGVSNISVSDSINFVDESCTTEDNNGHGTQMASIICSAFAGNEEQKAMPPIYSVVVANHRGFTKTSTLMEAIDWAINNNIRIINMSLGDYHKSNVLEKMINKASKNGIIMVAAAGNDGDFEDENRIMYPAAFANVLSVGSKNEEEIASFSNGGSSVDCFASATYNAIDINGNAVRVTGTSASAAYVAGTLLKNWCATPEIDAEEIIRSIKVEENTKKENENNSEVLTPLTKDDIIEDRGLTENFNMSDPSIVNTNEINEVLLSNMQTAINVPFFSWRTGSISCPEYCVWYKFTTNVEEAHQNGGRGWYGIQTQGNLDTMGYLYDSSGNEIANNDDCNGLNFKITAQLKYNQTYYVKVETFANTVGSFSFKVDYVRYDLVSTPETATEITNVYRKNQSVAGSFNGYGNIHYYTFTPERSCVMEIYTEGDSNTFGRLYCSSGSQIDSDNDSNGNGNFKITAHLTGGSRYYLAVSHTSPTAIGDYTLRFKFIKDYYQHIVNEQYKVVYWYADNQHEYPNMGNAITRSLVFVSDRAKAEFEDRILCAEYTKKNGLRSVLDNGTIQDILDFLFGTFISAIPFIGDTLSDAYDIGSMLYDFMSSSELQSYRENKHAIENTNRYIIGEHYWFTGYPNDSSTGSYRSYSTNSGTYYGKTYQRGYFVELALRNTPI